MAYDISVIIPVYNSEKYLTHCFNQLDNQTLEKAKFEVVFVDDGSRDSSWTMLKKYAENRVNIKIVHQDNQKQAAARNTGLSKATGTFVAFIDSDDTFSKDYLKEMLRRTSEVDWVISGIQRVFREHTDKLECACFEGLETTDKVLKKYASSNTELDAGVWSKLYRRSLLTRNGILFDNGNFFEDSFFNLQVLAHVNPQRIRYVHHCYYQLIKQDGSTTTQYNRKIDILANRYIGLCEDYLASNAGLNKSTEKIVINNLKARTIIHVIHHHIKYDKNIAEYPIRKIVKHNVAGKNIFRNELPCSYSIALFMLRFLPSIYCSLYKFKKVGK